MTEFNPYDWKFYLAERLHMEFDYHAEEFDMLYHPKWIDEESFFIVDDRNNRCENPSIYQVLDSLKDQYSFSMDQKFIFRKNK